MVKMEFKVSECSPTETQNKIKSRVAVKEEVYKNPHHWPDFSLRRLCVQLVDGIYHQ